MRISKAGDSPRIPGLAVSGSQREAYTGTLTRKGRGMLEKIDTGDRKVLITCDLYGLVATQPHHKTFKGSYAEEEAETYVKSRGLQDRSVIEAVMVLPRTVLPDIPQAELPHIGSDENAEVLMLTNALIRVLQQKTTRDTARVKRNYAELHKLLSERVEQ